MDDIILKTMAEQVIQLIFGIYLTLPTPCCPSITNLGRGNSPGLYNAGPVSSRFNISCLSSSTIGGSVRNACSSPPFAFAPSVVLVASVVVIISILPVVGGDSGIWSIYIDDKKIHLRFFLLR